MRAKSEKVKAKRLSKGFTLIEILIVVVLLGILAVAVLSAINPIEQIRKARDSGRKSDAAELLNSYERYYTTFQEYPLSGATFAASATAADDNSISSMVLVDELKAQFTSRRTVSDGELCVTVNAADLVSVCYEPESTSGQTGGFGPLMNASNTGPSGTCAAYDGDCSGSCYVCVPQ